MSYSDIKARLEAVEQSIAAPTTRDGPHPETQALLTTLLSRLDQVVGGLDELRAADLQRQADIAAIDTRLRQQETTPPPAHQVASPASTPTTTTTRTATQALAREGAPTTATQALDRGGDQSPIPAPSDGGGDTAARPVFAYEGLPQTPSAPTDRFTRPLEYIEHQFPLSLILPEQYKETPSRCTTNYGSLVAHTTKNHPTPFSELASALKTGQGFHTARAAVHATFMTVAADDYGAAAVLTAYAMQKGHDGSLGPVGADIADRIDRTIQAVLKSPAHRIHQLLEQVRQDALPAHLEEAPNTYINQAFISDINPDYAPPFRDMFEVITVSLDTFLRVKFPPTNALDHYHALRHAHHNDFATATREEATRYKECVRVIGPEFVTPNQRTLILLSSFCPGIRALFKHEMDHTHRLAPAQYTWGLAFTELKRACQTYKLMAQSIDYNVTAPSLDTAPQPPPPPPGIDETPSPPAATERCPVHNSKSHSIHDCHMFLIEYGMCPAYVKGKPCPNPADCEKRDRHTKPTATDAGTSKYKAALAAAIDSQRRIWARDSLADAPPEPPRHTVPPTKQPAILGAVVEAPSPPQEPTPPAPISEHDDPSYTDNDIEYTPMNPIDVDAWYIAYGMTPPEAKMSPIIASVLNCYSEDDTATATYTSD